MDAGMEVKVESEGEVERYDGTHACGFCSESVRGTVALQCSHCSANPVHWACVADTKYAGKCATCDGETMEAWRGAGGGAPSEIIDLRDLGEGDRGTRAAQAGGGPERRAREDKRAGAGSGRRLTETGAGAVGGGSEHEGGSQSNASTMTPWHRAFSGRILASMQSLWARRRRLCWRSGARQESSRTHRRNNTRWAGAWQ